ncbi:MAG: SPASM domain-containing protein, partial [Anaerolineae bacterium]|nr:SPASM domain-containing protein [Anaerolineae bacterium]
LRTSLAGNPSDALLDLVANATDEVVVSLDGDEQTHDARRGQGSHARTVEAVRRLTALRGRAEVSLAAVLPLPAARGEPGRQVRQVAHALGVRRVRFRPVLPLGRAMDSMPDLLPEAAWSSLSAAERMAYGFLPASSCGMGQNLYIEPDGAAYPCYAWHAPAWRLGNVLVPDGLAEVLNSSAWKSLGCATVDSNRGCRTCALRYLCGGMCRAWTFRGEAAQTDLNAPAGDCTRLRERAAGLLTSALAYLEIPEQRWLDVGFQLQ